MIKLSKREKVFLYILALALIVTGFSTLIIGPAMDKKVQLEREILDTETTLGNMKAEIAETDFYRSGIREQRALIAEEVEKVPPAMTDSALDRYITTLVQGKGLLAEELTISASEDAMPTSSLSAACVKVRASGTLRQFVALAEQVKNTEGVRIAKAQIRRTQSADAVENVRECTVDMEFAVLEYQDTVGLDRLADAVPTEG